MTNILCSVVIVSIVIVRYPDVECCVETIPDLVNANVVCNNLTDICTVSCFSNYIYYDGNQTKDYKCNNDNIWVPSIPQNGCLERTRAVFWLRFEVLYETTQVALYCLDAHKRALNESKDDMKQQISFYCNNNFVSVGDILINRTTSTTSSFTITTIFELEVGDLSTTESNKDACASLLQLNVDKPSLLVYGNTLQCSSGTSNITKTSASVRSDVSRCPLLNVLVINGNNDDYCVPDIPVLGGESFSYTANISQDVILHCKILFGNQISDIYWQHNSYNLSISNNQKYDGSSTVFPNLVLKNVTYDDAGIYTCKARSLTGTGRGLAMTLNVIARIEDIPDVRIPVGYYQLIAGENITLVCFISAFPSLTGVTWLRNISGSIETISVDHIKFIGSSIENPSLTISSADLSDSGLYICKGINVAGTSESSAIILNVTGDKPHVSTPVASYQVILGNNITINCNYSSIPPAINVLWIYNNSEITIDGQRYTGSSPDYPSLEITNVTFLDSGRYLCIVTNYLGNSSAGPIELFVTGDPPTVDASPHYYSVIIGDDVTLHCNVTGIPDMLSVSWIKNDSTEVIQSNKNDSHYRDGDLMIPSLTIYRVDEADKGLYICTATNLAGTTQSKAVLLNVTGDIPHVVIDLQEYYVVYGDNITIDCKITSHPVSTSVYWQKSHSDNYTDMVIDNLTFTGGTVKQPSLTILSVNFTHEGLYRCVASNKIGTGFSNTTFLNVTGDKPAVYVSLTSYDVIVTDNVTLLCNITATPEVIRVMWTRNTTNEAFPIIVDGVKYDGSTADKPSLTILKVTNDNEGWYTCLAENVIGKTTSAQIFLNVSGDVPMVNIPQNIFHVILGDNITIHCDIISHPPITYVTWQRNTTGDYTEVAIDNETYSDGNLKNPTLTINNATFSDYGEYVCLAGNVVGENKSSASQLIVIGDPPVVSVEPVQYDVIEDYNVTLSCNVTGIPKINYVSWKLNVTSRTGSSSRLIGGNVQDPSLTILSLELGDTGWYTCTAKNLAGTTNGKPIYLNVTEKCTKHSPEISNAEIDCAYNTGMGSCTVKCDTDYLFRDGTRSKMYNCTGRNTWTPSLPIATCLETTPSTYMLIASITYKTSAIALFCKSSHEQAVVNSYNEMKEQLTVYCNNNFVHVGPIVINSTISSTSSFDITTTFYIIIGDPSISKSNKDACGSLVENNIHKSTVLVYGNSLQCDTGSSTVTKTSGSVVSKEAQCPSGFSLIHDTNLCVSEVPRVGSTEPEYSAESGSNVTLYCEVNSNIEILSVHWEFTPFGVTDIIVIPTNNRVTGGTKDEPSLTIFNVTYSDVGVYKCVAANSAGVGKGPGIMLDVTSTVYNLPSVRILSSEYDVVLGKNVTLGCVIMSQLPITSVKWQKKTYQVFQDVTVDNIRFQGSLVSEPNIVLIGARFEDEGEYICVATNYAGSTSSNSSKLKIIGDIPSVNVSTTYYTVQFGENITIDCTVTGVPAVSSVEWFKNNSGSLLKVITDSVHYSGSSLLDPSLTLLSASTTDKGWYICSATNLAGTKKSQPVYLNVTANKPVITIPKDQYNVIAGDDITLDCRVEAYPPVISSSWTRNVSGVLQKIEADGDRFSVVNMSIPSLTITTVVLADTGIYTCQAENYAGTTYGKEIRLIILGEKPGVHVLSTQSVLYGDDVTLDCIINSLPNLTNVKWKNNATGVFVDITDNPNKYNGATRINPSLEILNVNFEDGGYYMCTGTNFLGTSSNVTKLKVYGGIPVVYVSPTVYHVEFGDNITMFCNASGIPNVTTLNWQTNTTGILINNHAGGNLLTPQLTLYNVDINDRGWYVCTATNKVGTGVSTPVFLNITGDEICLADIFPSVSNGIVRCTDDTILQCTVRCNTGYVTRDGNSTVSYRCDNNLWRSPLPPKGCIEYVLSFGQFKLQMTYNFSRVAVYCFASHQSILESLKLTFDQQVTDKCNNDIFKTGPLEITNMTSTTSSFSIYTIFTVRTRFNTATKIDKEFCTIALRHSIQSLSILTYTSPISCNSTTSSVGPTAGSLLSYTDICPGSTSIAHSSQETYCVSDIPSVVIIKPSYTAENEDSLRIECVVESKLRVQAVFWIHNNSGLVKTIYGNETGYSGSLPISPSLTISNIDFEHKGWYTCLAVNEIGTGSSAPVIVNVIERVRDLPIITSTSTTLQYEPGSAAHLDCSVNSKSEPSVVFWQQNKNGHVQTLQPFTFSDRYSGSSTTSPSLVINGVDIGDTGNYTCYAVNILGVSQGRSIQLIVKELDFGPIPDTGQSTGASNRLSCVKTFAFILLFASIGIVLMTSCSLVIYAFLPDNTSLFVEKIRKWRLSEKVALIVIEVYLSAVTASAISGIITVVECSEDDTGATMGLTSAAILPGIVISACYIGFCCYVQGKQNNKIFGISESQSMPISTSPVPEDNVKVKSWRPYEPSEAPVIEFDDEDMTTAPYITEPPDIYASTFRSEPIISTPILARHPLPPIQYMEHSEEKKRRRKKRKKKRKKETFDATNNSYDEQ